VSLAQREGELISSFLEKILSELFTIFSRFEIFNFVATAAERSRIRE